MVLLPFSFVQSFDTLYIHTIANYENSTFYEKNIVLENHQTTIKIPLEKEFEKP